MPLNEILKGVSRSFYLSIRFLPERVREPIGLAFLACKMADTIADTTLIPKTHRFGLLDDFRDLIRHPRHSKSLEIAQVLDQSGEGTFAERRLIQHLPQLMNALHQLPQKDAALLQWLLLELTKGMQIDLSFFEGPGKLKALQNMQSLDQYIYYVAGIVGCFWTRMMKNHFQFALNFGDDVEKTGEKLGKGLQLVNILRDLPRDLEQGRCYIPKEHLAKYNLQPEDLLDPDNLDEAYPCLMELAQLALEYLKEAENYCRFFPWYALRLKMVVRLPAHLGRQTLTLLENSNEWLNPEEIIKVSRRQVYINLLKSLC